MLPPALLAAIAALLLGADPALGTYVVGQPIDALEQPNSKVVVDRHAFTHVFCGDDWGRKDIGGLHWLPRYAQLEAERRVCYAGPVRRGGVLGDGMYTFKFTGVSPWSCAVKPVGGFTVEHDPVTMVAVGTRAFVRCCARSGKNAVGVYSASDVGHQRWRIACGTRNGTYGIATFYPVDETPTCGE